MDPIVDVRDLTYGYPGGRVPALQGVSLEVGAGEMVVVAGASGSGKSTLLRAISGLVPHFHGGTFAGQVVVAGMDTHEHGPGSLAAVVGTLFQDPETQVVMGTPRAELAFPLENRGEPPAAIARGVEEAALALGIGPLLERSTSELSGGELQRVSLGAALAGRPAVVLLDEPTSQLDPVAGDELIGLLRRLNEDHDTTILLAEHRLERCLSYADRVIALRDGRVVCDAPPERFLEWAAEVAPELQTPGARLLHGLGLPVRTGVKRSRAALRTHGLLPEAEGEASGSEKNLGRVEPDRIRPHLFPLSGKNVGRTAPGPAGPGLFAPGGNGPDGPGLFAPGSNRTAGARRRRKRPDDVLAFERVWHELRDGPAILRGVTLSLAAGERVAVMGRNGAGKSTLLRHAAGLAKPTRGRVRATGRVALLLQNPGDYLVHDTVAQEASPEALARVGLAELGDRHPRDLSGGEKQRLALAIVLDSEPPAVVCLDEPTRGMDRLDKQRLARMLRKLDAGVLVATHDPEFVAAFAERVVLLADGAPIADGPAAEVLAGGTYFATETARILGGAGGALTPEQGIALLAQPEMSPV